MRNNSAHSWSSICWIVVPLALGSGAGCGSSHGASVDGGLRSDGGFASDGGATDGGRTLDGGPPTVSCDAADAVATICPDALCDRGPTWYWNGEVCFPIECGACAGDDCPSGFASSDECARAHEGCESAMCRTTGGEWMWFAPECGHYVCGAAPAADCESPFPVCDCGANRSFDTARGGCYDDMSCPSPEPVAREVLCMVTGGTWEGICCDTVCGIPCAAACAVSACNCGEGRVFDEARGCRFATRCYEPSADDTCEGDARCESGTICCQPCGGAGCFGPPTCQPPLCDDDPHTDECGNNPLAA